ncbi:16794_t:CDS:2 [Acaulospora morrowiae]|uniref:Phosphatidate cytidylyltransferase, mitochondrial n=1 Tax=Acaulospora morrowiae TaxID=94023 RepID=A0A9N8WKQ7_9GLOM|nr:16794_t:CDS:2 [Acaulospora morrowiae]
MRIIRSVKTPQLNPIRYFSTTQTNSAALTSNSSSQSSSKFKSSPENTIVHPDHQAIKTRHTVRLSPDFGKNQHLPIDNELNERLKKVLLGFNAPIRYAFAYGSGVFPQKGYEGKPKPMMDFIFAVNHPQHWHSLNINQNRSHYSFMGTLGSRAVSVLQENTGAGVYFNTYVKMDNMLIKYGVVSVDSICKDLLHWENLYMAGRMHKPIIILRDDARIRLAQQVNLTSSLKTALLLLPKNFTEEQLYLTIASISFKGDFRRYVGENPNKVKNVVSKQMGNFNLLYADLIKGLPNVEFTGSDKLQQDDNPRIRGKMIQDLPRVLRHKIREEHRMKLIRNGKTWVSDDKEIYKNIASSEGYEEYIETGLSEIVFWPALTQSLKGILTAGMFKSAKYTSSKLSKWILRPQ